MKPIDAALEELLEEAGVRLSIRDEGSFAWLDGREQPYPFLAGGWGDPAGHAWLFTVWQEGDRQERPKEKGKCQPVWVEIEEAQRILETQRRPRWDHAKVLSNVITTLGGNYGENNDGTVNWDSWSYDGTVNIGRLRWPLPS